jgi:hypothetical protein
VSAHRVRPKQKFMQEQACIRGDICSSTVSSIRRQSDAVSSKEGPSEANLEK